uniref:(northern house mosquito) hypothetical protein n=1 Tax=Culex pipiens TaxID=7175 RepID=A0A8D8NYB9_CULPI
MEQLLPDVPGNSICGEAAAPTNLQPLMERTCAGCNNYQPTTATTTAHGATNAGRAQHLLLLGEQLPPDCPAPSRIRIRTYTGSSRYLRSDCQRRPKPSSYGSFYRNR